MVVVAAMIAAGCSSSSTPSAPHNAAPGPSSAVADFYQYPSPSAIADKQNGEIFASEPMTVTEPLQRASSQALRIMYRSQGVGGQPVAVTGFLLIPRGDPPSGGWPVVAWAHGTAGVGPNCAPSRYPNLYITNTYAPLIERLLLDGFAVVGTDYPGLGFPDQLHPYVQQEPEANSVIDSVTAARHLSPQLSPRWFAVGHSQGGQAALAAGESAPRGSGLQFLGTVSIAPASHGQQIIALIGGLRPADGFPFYLEAAYASLVAVSATLFDPSLQYTDLLSPELAAQIPAAKQMCLVDLETGGLATYLMKLDPPLPNESVLNPSWASNPGIQRFAASINPATQRSAGPILLVQGLSDAAVPPSATDALNGELCNLGDVVQYRTYPGEDHDTILNPGGQAYSAIVQWLKDRLQGSPPPQTCPTP
jgi:pimeloyl-ACP methyl ester carboxylesterase